MRIDLKQLFSIPGVSRDIACEIAQDELSDIKGYSFASPIGISGRINNRAGVVRLEYTAETVLSITCDRCLKELERAYSFDFQHIVVPSVSSDNDEYIVADGESIDLSEIALTDILLQLPTKTLCREDCKGLCMVCGCDLNESVCNCLNNIEL